MVITLKKIAVTLNVLPFYWSEETSSLQVVQANSEVLDKTNIEGLNEAHGNIKKNTLIYLQKRQFLSKEVLTAGDFFLIDESLRSHTLFLENKWYFFVKNARQELIKILNLFDKHRDFKSYQPLGTEVQSALVQNKRATIGSNVLVGENFTVGNNAVLMGNNFIGNNVTLGDNVIIHPNVSLGHETVIGDNVIIQGGTVIGGDSFGYENVDGDWKLLRGIGNVLIEDAVEIGCNTCIDRATISSTVIGYGTKIGNLVNIAHNVTIGKHCLLVGTIAIAGSCTIGDRVIMGGQVGLINNLTIADGTIMGGQTGVMRNQLTKDAKIFGSPSRKWQDTMELQLIFNKLLAQEREKRKNYNI